MAGNSNSGRRTNYDSTVRREVLEKCWDILKNALNDPDVSDKEKREIALKLVPRNIPQEITGKDGEPLACSPVINYNYVNK